MLNGTRKRCALLGEADVYDLIPAEDGHRAAVALNAKAVVQGRAFWCQHAGAWVFQNALAVQVGNATRDGLLGAALVLAKHLHRFAGLL